MHPPSPPAPPFVAGNYLELYYNFDDGSGDVVKDSSGNDRDGSIKNEAPFVDGKFGKAIDLANNTNKGSNDTTGKWIQAPGFSMGGGPMAVSVWVNYDNFRNWSRIIDFAKGANQDNLILANRGSGSEVHWGIRRAGSERSVRQGGFWEKNKWLHVVASYDSDTKLRLYKNGKLIKTGNGHAPVSTLRIDQRIGRSHWNDSYLDAQLDELRVLFNWFESG